MDMQAIRPVAHGTQLVAILVCQIPSAYLQQSRKAIAQARMRLKLLQSA